MISTYQSLNEIVLELEPNEEFQPHVVLAALSNAVANSNLWSVFLVVSPSLANEHADFLRENQFTVAGFVSRDAKTYLRLRRSIRTSGEAGGSQTLAVPEPMLERSDAEKQAIDLMLSRYGPRTGVL